MAGFSSDPLAALNRIVDTDKFKCTDNLVTNYELNDCVEWILNNRYCKVCLQFPDSLLVDSADIALYIEQQLSEKVYILGDTSYGSCCVDEVAAQHVSGDAIIHFGHACLSPVTLLPVFYIFPKEPLSIQKFYDELEKLNIQGPSLILYDVKYAHISVKLRRSVPEKLKELIAVSELNVNGHENPCSLWCSLLKGDDCHSAMVLSRAFCQPSSSNFSSVFYLGDRNSQNLQNIIYLMKGTKIMTYTDDNGLQSVNNNVNITRYSYLVERLKDAKNIGIIAGTLGVKGYLEAINYVKKLCHRAKKKTYVIVVGKPSPAKLANFPEIDIFVAICCAEANFGNKKDYLQPIVGLFEVDLAFNENRSWDSPICMDFRDLIPGGNHYIIPSDNADFISSVSLVSNKLRGSTACVTESTEIAIKPDLPVGLNESLNITRTWNGLTQSLGDTEPQLAVKGRSGIASGYAQEGLCSDEKRIDNEV